MAAENSEHVWESIFRSREWGKYPPEHVVRFIMGSFHSARDRGAIHLLEVGCGPGANVWFMAREGFSVSAIDASPTAIQLAKKRLSGEGISADLRVGDFVTLPWPDNTFDAVVENVSLYCNRWPAVQQALGEIRRVLKPGARFLSSFFSERTWGYGLGNEIEEDGFIDIGEGPIAGTGFCLFLRRERLMKLFSGFDDVMAERVSRTMDNERHLIEQFVVTCCKPT